jgi:hypothetical protein
MQDFLIQYGFQVPSGAVNLAFIQIPPFESQEVASLVSTAGWINENKNSEDYIDLSSNGGVISYTFPYTQATTNYTIPFDNSVNPPKQILKLISQPIEILSPIEDETGAWHLRFKDGVFHRRMTLDPTESDYSWLRIPTASGGPGFQDGDELVLIYTLPEFNMQTYEIASGAYFDGSRKIRVVKEDSEIIDSRTLQVSNSNIISIESCNIMIGSGTVSVSATIVDPNGLLRIEDRILSESDEVQVTYTYYEDLLTYRGYVDDQGTYHDLDLNPSYGHIYDGGYPTKELINTPVFIYLLPTAAMKIGSTREEIDRGDLTTDNGTNSFILYSILNLKINPLRWATEKRGNPNNEYYTTQDPSSYFGYAQFGVSTFSDYENPVTYLLDGGGFNGLEQSAVLLGEVYVGPNSTLESVKVVDTRSRGGGIPEDPRHSISHNGEFIRIEEIETYLDISAWDGRPVTLDGVVVFEFPKQIQDGSGGYPKIPEDKIRMAVEKNLASGILYVIRYRD